MLDHLVLESINQAGGTCHPETGHYAKLVYKGCETKERAEEIKRALFRSAVYMHKHGHANVSMSAKIVRRGNEWDVEFLAINKEHAQAYVVRKYGEDRTKWPYSPRRGDRNYG